MTTTPDNFKVYINDHCPSCGVVIDYLRRNEITCEVINVDFEHKMPPVDLMIFPALFGGDRLLAYGEDIIETLRKRIGIGKA